MRSILESIVCVIACLGLILGLDACSGGNPTSPSSVGANVPKSAPGFEPFVVEIPDSPVPLTVYTIDSNPAKGGVVTQDRRAYLVVDLRGPSSGRWTTYVSIQFLGELDDYDPCRYNDGGAGKYVGENGDGVLTVFYNPTKGSSAERAIYRIWISNGPTHVAYMIDRQCPTVIHVEHLGWH